MASPQKNESKKHQGVNDEKKFSDVSSVGVLPDETINFLKNPKTWYNIVEKRQMMGCTSPWGLNEEQIECLYMQYPLFISMYKQGLAHDDEDIVWEDDIWGLKEIKKIPDA